jgi:hypothetical protein
VSLYRFVFFNVPLDDGVDLIRSAYSEVDIVAKADKGVDHSRHLAHKALVFCVDDFLAQSFDGLLLGFFGQLCDAGPDRKKKLLERNPQHRMSRACLEPGQQQIVYVLVAESTKDDSMVETAKQVASGLQKRLLDARVMDVLSISVHVALHVCG